jgi:hypothetical protein
MRIRACWPLALAAVILCGTAPAFAQTEAGGVVSGLDWADLSRCDDGDFNKIAQLTRLQKLSFGKGLNGQRFALLTLLPEVNAFATNGADLDDEDVKLFARFTKLKSLQTAHARQHRYCRSRRGQAPEGAAGGTDQVDRAIAGGRQTDRVSF